MQLDARPELASTVSGDLGRSWTEAAMRDFLADGNGGIGPLSTRLRELRRRVMLGLMTRDLGGAAPLSEVCATMTALAQTAIAGALESLVPELEATLGAPVSGSGERQELVVVGMGKLGGGELNVSSDIDLVFAYPEDGETRPGEGGRSVSNHEFFAALGKRLIALLSEPTPDGFVFRVDMRLRPWGEPGPLAMSFDALEQYLVAQGREWERYAWIKGRPLTGGQAARDALSALVRPFVFRKYLDYGAYGAMRELHAQIREEVARRELAGNIKLGPGGIREIEFIAQVFQLIRGGREPELQARPTLQVLALLAKRNLISGEDAAALASAYDFLRRLEHRLQYLDDAQTHELPEDAEDRLRVSKAMGHAGWAAFTRALEKHRGAVARCFEKIFAAQDQTRHPLAGAWSSADHAGHSGKVALLRELRFADPEAAAARLSGMREGSRYQSLPESSRERVDALVPRLLERAATRPNPDDTLARALALVETVSRRAAYLALLDEHPVALDRLTELISASSWAAEYLNLHPVLLDELLDSRLLLAAPDWRALSRNLRRSLMALRRDGDAGERQMDVLREAHHAQLFHLLAQDLAGALSVERLADHLSDLADIMLQATLELCWTQILEQRKARGLDAGLPEQPHFAVIAYGKLGGKELGYASDLDLVFLYDDGGDESAVEAYGRLAQRMNSWLNSRTAAGVLFETDLRLRPDGASGLMVSSMDAFRRYQRESAWVWEHQALTRARFCAGEATAGAAFEEERRHILGRQRDIANLAAEVRAMRRTMLEGHPNKSELFDLKHDRGGMVDIEFLVQFLVLAHAHRHSILVRNDGNIALLGYASELGLVDAGLAAQVQDAYRAYRRRQHALRLEGARYARVAREEVAAHATATLALWKAVMGEADL
jgi:glutamate-ammonia-ligase adenylyltransferase